MCQKWTPQAILHRYRWCWGLWEVFWAWKPTQFEADELPPGGPPGGKDVFSFCCTLFKGGPHIKQTIFTPTELFETHGRDNRHFETVFRDSFCVILNQICVQPEPSSTGWVQRTPEWDLYWCVQKRVKMGPTKGPILGWITRRCDSVENTSKTPSDDWKSYTWHRNIK